MGLSQGEASGFAFERALIDFMTAQNQTPGDSTVSSAGEGYGVDFAGRDIEAGDELTVDYGIVEGVRP